MATLRNNLCRHESVQGAPSVEPLAVSIDPFYFMMQSSKRKTITLFIGAVIVIVSTIVIARYSKIPSPKPFTATSVMDRTIATLEEQFQKTPEKFAVSVALANAYMQKIRETADSSLYQKIEQIIEHATRIDPENPELPSLKAQVALGRHQFNMALTLGQEALKRNPNNPLYYGIIGDAEIELGHYEQAVATLQTMIDRKPDYSSFSRIAYARELYGDVEGAIEAMQSAVQAGSAYPEHLAWGYTEIGKLYWNSNRPTQALAEFEKAVATVPNYTPALRWLGHMALSNGNTSQAQEYFQKAVDLLPIDTHYADLADFYSATEQNAKASQLWTIVKLTDENSEKNGVVIDLELASFLADHDLDLPEALKRAERGYNNRSSVFAADTVGWAYYKNNQYDQAKHYSDESLRLGTQDPIKFFHAGMIAKARGQKAMAKKYLAKALQLNPHFSILSAPVAQETLKNL